MKNILKSIIIFVITLQAKIILRKHKPFIIGVTGNLGKTSTKDLIYSVLNFSANSNIRKTEKSLNSEYGVPLTIIGAKSGWNSITKWILVIWKGFQTYFDNNYPEVLVLEVGADRPGDISYFNKWLSIDICVITQFAKYPVHVENFNNDRSLLIREKRYLIESVKDGGKIIFNASCLDSAKMIQDAKEDRTINKNIEIISFGYGIGDYTVSDIKNNLSTKSVTAKVLNTNQKEGDSFSDITISCSNIWGDAAIWTSLPAVIIGNIFKINKDNIVESIHNSRRSPGRMNILNSEWGQIIVDDTYNSSPLAVENGLSVLGEFKKQNRDLQTVAILGDMLELGEYSLEAHRYIGDIVVNNKIDLLFVIGLRALDIKNRAIELGMNKDNILEYNNSKVLAKEISVFCVEGTIKDNKSSIIYVKGSQSMRMEKIVAQIINKDVKVSDILARQEEEWMKR